MSSTQTSAEPTTSTPGVGIETKLEVVVIPVSDVDRAKRFYGNLGWRLDGEFTTGDEWRVVQMTPPGSPCSILFGKGFTKAAPGSVRGTFLVVNDVAAARAELIAHGAEVSEVFHFAGPLQVFETKGRVPGRDPEDRSYFSWAEFSDPDGNTWLLQEIKTRLPGRGFNHDVGTLTDLLRETEEHHGAYEAKAPKHHWSSWYSAYMIARERGKTADEAAREAALNVERTRQQVTV